MGQKVCFFWGVRRLPCHWARPMRLPIAWRRGTWGVDPEAVTNRNRENNSNYKKQPTTTNNNSNKKKKRKTKNKKQETTNQHPSTTETSLSHTGLQPNVFAYNFHRPARSGWIVIANSSAMHLLVASTLVALAVPATWAIRRTRDGSGWWWRSPKMPIPSRIHGMLIIFTWMVDFWLW